MLSRINDVVSRVRVLAKTAVTWLIAGQVAVQYLVSQEVLVAYPDVVQWGGQVVALLGGVVLVVRRVTPAAKPSRGLLPPAGP